MKAARLIKIILIAILLFSLLSAATKDPCQAVDYMKYVEQNMEKLKAAETELYFFKDHDGNQILFVDAGGCACAGDPDITIFYKKDIPKKVRDYNAYENGKGSIKSKIAKAKIIDAKYFVTKKAVKLGMAIDEVLAIYGSPDKTAVLKKNPNIVVKYTWEVPGKMENENDELPVISAKSELMAERIKENANKSLTDRIYENAFRPSDALIKNSTKPPPPEPTPPKKPLKKKICTKIETGLTVMIDFVDGKAAVISISDWGV